MLKKLTLADEIAANPDRANALADAARFLSGQGQISESDAKTEIRKAFTTRQRLKVRQDRMFPGTPKNRGPSADNLLKLAKSLRSASTHASNIEQDRKALRALAQTNLNLYRLRGEDDTLADVLADAAESCEAAAGKLPKPKGGRTPETEVRAVAEICVGLLGMYRPDLAGKNRVSEKERDFLGHVCLALTGAPLPGLDGEARGRAALKWAKAKRSRKDNPE